MACNYPDPKETPQQAEKRVSDALDKLMKNLGTGAARIVIGPGGALTFAGWNERDRGGLTDACGYRLMQLHHPFELQQAVAMAEKMSGHKVNVQAINSGTHSHDGGKTWHSGH